MADQQEELEAAETETERIWAEEANWRFQEIQRGEVAVQDSDAVFEEARARLR
jgi:hypothetical protein